MHVVNLTIGYVLGIKENTRTHDEVVDGAVKKVQRIVTPGGAFKQGMVIVKAGRAIVNFFGRSPQRKHKLEAVRELYGLPAIQLTNYPDTRVSPASSSKLSWQIIMPSNKSRWMTSRSILRSFLEKIGKQCKRRKPFSLFLPHMQ